MSLNARNVADNLIFSFATDLPTPAFYEWLSKQNIVFLKDFMESILNLNGSLMKFICGLNIIETFIYFSYLFYHRFNFKGLQYVLDKFSTIFLDPTMIGDIFNIPNLEIIVQHCGKSQLENWVSCFDTIGDTMLYKSTHILEFVHVINPWLENIRDHYITPNLANVNEKTGKISNQIQTNLKQFYRKDETYKYAKKTNDNANGSINNAHNTVTESKGQVTRNKHLNTQSNSNIENTLKKMVSPRSERKRIYPFGSDDDANASNLNQRIKITNDNFFCNEINKQETTSKVIRYVSSGYPPKGMGNNKKNPRKIKIGKYIKALNNNKTVKSRIKDQHKENKDKCFPKPVFEVSAQNNQKQNLIKLPILNESFDRHTAAGAQLNFHVKKVCNYQYHNFRTEIGHRASDRNERLLGLLSEGIKLVKSYTCMKNQLQFLKLCYDCNVTPNFIKNSFNLTDDNYINHKTKKHIRDTCISMLKSNIEKKLIETAKMITRINQLFNKIKELNIKDNKFIEDLYGLSVKISICNWMNHRKKFNFLLKNTIHKCHFNNFKIECLKDGTQNLIDMNETKNCKIDHFTLTIHDYLIKLNPMFTTQFKDKDNITIVNICNKDDNENFKPEEWLTKLGPNNALPFLESKSKMLKEIEINIERSYFQMRWKHKLQAKDQTSDKNQNFIESVPFENKKARLPEPLDNKTEDKLFLMKNDILKVFRDLNLKKDQNKIDIQHAKIVKKFCVDNNMVIIPSDKTKRNILISKNEFKEMGFEFLNNNKDYTKIDKNHSKQIENECNNYINKIRHKLRMDNHNINKCLIKNSHPAKFFFNIKDHKEKKSNGNYPIRPIASVHGTPVDGIDFILQKILTQASKLVPTNISDTNSILNDIDDLNKEKCHFESDLNILSLDVCNLYPSIPTKKGISMIKKFLKRISEDINWYGLNIADIEQMLQIICNNYYVEFQNHVYLQKNGVPMGARFAPPFAIIYMYELERKIIEDLKNNEEDISILLYKRYIDDILLIYKYSTTRYGESKHEYIKNHFNKYDENIQFTVETPNSKNGFLPFLDTEIKTHRNKIIYRWYQKSLHSGNIMRGDSQISVNTKKAFVSNCFRRLVHNNNDQRELFNGLMFIISQLKRNGYMDDMIEGGLRNIFNNNHTSKKKFNATNSTMMKLPFINDTVNSKLKEIINSHNLNLTLINKKNTQPSQLGSNPKETKPCINCSICNHTNSETKCTASNVIYQIDCNFCDKKYIGRTTRSLNIRAKEHFRDWQKAEHKSALGEHMDTVHNFTDIKQNGCTFSILDKSHDTVDNILKEVYQISKHDNLFNRQLELHSTYTK